MSEPKSYTMADFDEPTPDRFLRTTPNHARILATVAQRDEAVRLLRELLELHTTGPCVGTVRAGVAVVRAFLVGVEK